MATDVLRQLENHPTSKTLLAQSQNRSKAIAKRPSARGKYDQSLKINLPTSLPRLGHRRFEDFWSSRCSESILAKVKIALGATKKLSPPTLRYSGPSSKNRKPLWPPRKSAIQKSNKITKSFAPRGKMTPPKKIQKALWPTIEINFAPPNRRQTRRP